MSGPFNSTFQYPVQGTVPTFNVYDSIILSYTTNLTGTVELSLVLWSYQKGSTSEVNSPDAYTNIPYDGPWQIDSLGDHGQFDHYPIYAWAELDHGSVRYNPDVQFTVTSQTSVPATTWALDSLIVSGTTEGAETSSSTISTASANTILPTTSTLLQTGSDSATAVAATTTASPSISSSSSSGLSTGAKAGIGVGCALGAILLLSIISFILWHRRRGRQSREAGAAVSGSAELSAHAATAAAANNPQEKIGDYYRYDNEAPRELEASSPEHTSNTPPSEVQRYELAGS